MSRAMQFDTRDGDQIETVQCLDIHTILDRIGRVAALTDAQEMLLTRMVIHHWDPHTSTISATPRELRLHLPKWSARKVRGTRRSLEQKGFLRPILRPGRAISRPTCWTLHLPIDRTDVQ